MIVCLRLVGGLGNQLHIRSFGYALEACGNEVVFDKSPLDNDEARRYVLDQWNTEVPFGLACGQSLSEPDLLYHPEFLKNYEQDTTLTGYWQSPLYITGVEDQVRRAFTLRRYPSEKSLAVANKIHQSNSVSLHVRRSDNLSVRGMAYHGLCSGEYYARAIDHIVARVQDPHFFIFSDDIDWCKQNFVQFGHPITFVDHNTPGVTVDSEFSLHKTDGTEHEDLFLMRLCKHAIIARSTFSYWGAWLGPHQAGLVVRPQQWLVGEHNRMSATMFPSEWAAL